MIYLPNCGHTNVASYELCVWAHKRSGVRTRVGGQFARLLICVAKPPFRDTTEVIYEVKFFFGHTSEVARTHGTHLKWLERMAHI